VPDHELGRLDRDDREIGRFVGAGAGADVHDGRGVAERRPNYPRDPRVGATCPGVCAADSVVENVLDERSLVCDRLSSAIVRWFKVVAADIIPEFDRGLRTQVVPRAPSKCRPGPISHTVEQELPQLVGEK